MGLVDLEFAVAPRMVGSCVVFAAGAQKQWSG